MSPVNGTFTYLLIALLEHCFYYCSQIDWVYREGFVPVSNGFMYNGRFIVSFAFRSMYYRSACDTDIVVSDYCGHTSLIIKG